MRVLESDKMIQIADGADLIVVQVQIRQILHHILQPIHRFQQILTQAQRLNQHFSK